MGRSEGGSNSIVPHLSVFRSPRHRRLQSHRRPNVARRASRYPTVAVTPGTLRPVGGPTLRGVQRPFLERITHRGTSINHVQLRIQTHTALGWKTSRRYLCPSLYYPVPQPTPRSPFPLTDTSIAPFGRPTTSAPPSSVIRTGWHLETLTFGNRSALMLPYPPQMDPSVSRPLSLPLRSSSLGFLLCFLCWG